MPIQSRSLLSKEEEGLRDPPRADGGPIGGRALGSTNGLEEGDYHEDLPKPKRQLHPLIREIPLDVDDFNDLELDRYLEYEDIVQKHAIQPEEGFQNVVVIDGLPIVDQSKEEKLLAVVTKVFKNVGKIERENLYMPMAEDEDGTIKNRGFLFIQFKDQKEAKIAVQKGNNYKFDKRHTLKVNPFYDIDKYGRIDDEWVEESAQDEFHLQLQTSLGAQPKKGGGAHDTEIWEREFIYEWLKDSRARGQYAMLYENELSLLWNNKTDPPQVEYSRKNWTEMFFQWSPLGSFLLTTHQQGVALWGGVSMTKFARLLHPGVRHIQVSPSETFLVTYSTMPFTDPDEILPGKAYSTPTGIKMAPLPPDVKIPWTSADEGNEICVWDIRSGKLLKTFPMALSDDQTKQKLKYSQLSWPVFKWTDDDKYFGRLVPGKGVAVYQSSTMTMIGQEPIKVNGIKEFEWQPLPQNEKGWSRSAIPQPEDERRTGTPCSHKLAYWTPESENVPCRVTIMSVPKREVLRTVNLVNVRECKLFFQQSGTYLLVKVDRYQGKARKSTVANLEIFRMREKEIPVEMITISDHVISLGWEPHGNRFAVLTIAPSDLPVVTGSGKVGETAGVTVATAKAALYGGVVGKMVVSFYEVVNTVQPPVEAVKALGKKKKKEATNSKQAVNDAEVQKAIRLLKRADRKSVNSIFWSPRGRFCCLAGLRNLAAGEMEFWDCEAAEEEEATTKKETIKTTSKGGDKVTKIAVKQRKEQEPVQQLGSGDHYRMTDVEWDPAGRFVLTSSSVWGFSSDSAPTDLGYTMWDLAGNKMGSQTLKSFKQISWRPKPRSLLDRETAEKIASTLSDFAQEFDEEDIRASSAVDAKVLEERSIQLNEWIQWRRQQRIDMRKSKRERAKLRNMDDSSSDEGEDWLLPADFKKEKHHRRVKGEEIEEVVEEVIEETEQVVD